MNNTNTTPAQAMKEQLEKVGLPYHDIQCYGRQITVECIAHESCKKWALLLVRFAKVRGMIKSVAYVGDTQNSGNPKVFDVWRVYAAIE